MVGPAVQERQRAAASRPASAEAAGAKAAPADSAPTDATPAGSGTAKPGTAKPGTAKSRTAKSRTAKSRTAKSAAIRPAATLPVAQVAVDVSLPHLDRPFEYLVPESLDAAATVGCRVRVRFSGRLTSGYLLRRTAESEHQGRLGYLERVVSPEPVLTEEIAGLARAVADRYGGTLADVLRLAIPPRHAAVESAARRVSPAKAAPQANPSQSEANQAAPNQAGPNQAGPNQAGPNQAGPNQAAPNQSGSGQPEGDQPEGDKPEADQPAAQGADAAQLAAVRPPEPEPGSWARYAAGASFLAALAAGRAPRAIWSALPGAGPATAGPATAGSVAAGADPAGSAGTESAGGAPLGEGGWAAEIALAAAAAAASGRGVVIVVPDARDLEQADAALAAALGPGAHVVLSASLGPPSATGAGSPPSVARWRWWPAPGRPCSRRFATWAWWCSGMRATTCTPSRARRTRMPARCWHCARTGPVPPR